MFAASVEFIIVVAILIFSLVIHENTHARVAYYLGDSTAKDMGRFSFNPLKHITLVGMLLPIGLYIIGVPIFSFAKPVIYNPKLFKHPRRGMILVGLSAPFANFVLAVIACVLYNRLSILPEAYLAYFNEVCANILIINLMLCIFNLIPIPPLDGSIIYMSSIIDKDSKLAKKLEDYGAGFLFALLIMMPLIGKAYNKDYHSIELYLKWCVNNMLSILSPLAG